MKPDANNSINTILILEDNFIEATLLTEMLSQELPEAEIIHATTVSKAQSALESHRPDLFVIDINLPDGNGIDFMCDAQMICPDSGTILITSDPLPEYQMQAADMGALKFLEKPINRQSLSSLLHSAQSSETAEDEGEFKGALSKLSTADVIQLKCLARATTRLKFSNASGEICNVYLVKGNICHAQTHELEGMEAFSRVVGWKRGNVVELPEEFDGEATIEGEWQSLMLNAVQMSDESI